MSKITSYATLATPTADDVLVIVDVHDSTQDPTGTTKQMAVSSLDARYLAKAGGSLTGSLSVGGALITPPAALTDGTSIAVNAAASNAFRVTIGGNRTIANPSNASDGQTIVFEVIQDATGSRTLAWDTQYSFPSSLGTPVLSVTAAFHDFIVFRYDSATTTWYCVGFTPQLSAASALPVSQGGTGLAALTAYELLAAGTTSTGALQQVGVGTATQVLTSNGPGALPTFQPPTNLIIPPDLGQLAWTCDPGAVSGSGLLVTGTVYFCTFFLRTVQTIGHIGVHVVTQGSVLTSGQSLLGVYSIGATTGTLQEQTADQSAVWGTSTGGFNTALTTSYTNAPAGRYAVAVLSVGTTPPTFRSAGSTSPLANLGLTGAGLRIFINGTGATVLPPTITLSANASSGSISIGAVINP